MKRKFAPRVGEHLTRVRDTWKYRRNVPEKFRMVIGKASWTLSLGKISQAEARVRAKHLAAEHDALLYRLDSMGEAERIEERVDQLRRMAAVAKAARPTTSDAVDRVLARELHKLGWTAPRAEQARWAANFMRASLGLVTDDEERELLEIKIERAEKEAASDAAAANGRTLLTALPPWRAMKQQSDSTWRKHVERVKAFVQFLGRDLPLAHVTREHADSFILHLAATPDKLGRRRTGNTLTKYKDTFSAFFRWASRRPNWGVTNVFADLEVPKDTRPRKARSYDSFTDEQAMEFRSVAHARWSAFDHVASVDAARHARKNRHLGHVIECVLLSGLWFCGHIEAAGRYGDPRTLVQI